MSLSEIRVRSIIVVRKARGHGVYQNKEPCEANIGMYFNKAHPVKLVAKGFTMGKHHSCMAVW
jgi:hypothetical protein